MPRALVIPTVLLSASLALAASSAGAVDHHFAGSAQLDYHFVPTAGANVNRGVAGQYDFDGFTLEATQKLSVDISDHFSTNVKICFGCHGFELDMAYVDYRVVDELNLRAGHFSPSFGSFNLRHDAANRKLSDQPLPYDMGRMLRLRAWNLGVLPSPFPDNGLEVDGTHWFGNAAQLDYAAYAVGGFKSNSQHPLDLDFRLSRTPYYVDNNGRPTVGGRIAITVKTGDLSDLTVGASGMYGTYDNLNTLAYAIGGADLAFRFNRTNLRFEYLVRRTEFDASDQTILALPVSTHGQNFFVKHGAFAELEQPLSQAVDLVVRADGLYRVGNFLAEPTGQIPLSRTSYIARYTVGGSYHLEQGLRIKVSTEFWQFSDDFDGRKYDVGVHIALVGMY
jgi:hypothetical protein